MREFHLEDQVLHFTVDVLNLTERLPNTIQGHHLQQLLTRASTSIAINYEEAQAADSIAEYIYQLRLTLKDLREVLISLKIIRLKGYLFEQEVLPMLRDCGELTARLTASQKTAREDLDREQKARRK